MEFKGKIFMDDLSESVSKDVKAILKAVDEKIDWPEARKNKDTSKADYVVILQAIAGKLKRNADELSKETAEKVNKYLEANKDKNLLIAKAEAVGGYLNLRLARSPVFKAALKGALNLGDEYGKSDTMKGKKVIVEHTSANPNGPLHIGNLRNVITGGILAEILKCVGYDVKQHFYVNDLGAQIGLTAVGFKRIYKKLKPSMKIDHWIGFIYAVMNTFTELEAMQVDPVKISELLKKGGDVDHVVEVIAKDLKAIGKEVDKEKLEEYAGIFEDLKERQPELFSALLEECSTSFGSIKKEAGALNLAYERNEPWAVEILRKMVISDLSGMQETLDTYNIRHDQFDFESELGWEGSNQAILEVFQKTPYYVPPTQCNDKGKPEGAYLNLDQMLKDRGFPQGKKGYQPNYPPLYILRPDGSTLYVFRDVVYSLKKATQADMVLNVIAAEQNIPQEKVALGGDVVRPGLSKVQHHVSYELVKLVNDEGKEVKMSGRRGRYVLADSLYQDLKSHIQAFMVKNQEMKEDKLEPALFEQIIHEVSTAAMKYALLCVSLKSKINFNVKKVCDFEDSTAPFLLYNATRFFSLFQKFETGVADGSFPALPPIDKVDFSLLKEDGEWELLFEYILAFPTLINHIGCPNVPELPALPEFPVHLVCDFLIFLVRTFSRYWGGTKVLIKNPTPEQANVMHARLYLLKALQLVLNNGLKMLTMKPLPRM